MQMANLIGRSLGRYHLLEQLGEGGMAVVYKAYDTRLKRDVAVKIIRSTAFPEEQFKRLLKRFKREAKALAHLTHPNIVQIVDYGDYEGAPYLVMPYLSGGILKERLNQGPLPWQQAVRLLIPIADALAYAHGQGIIHRDVKPSNILITQSGAPMLADFGVAKFYDTEETADLTGTGMGVGTPEYMAPEQVTSRSADHRVDIYSIGVVFYEMVTGRKPYQADTPMAVLFKHANEPLPRPKQFIPDLPDSIEQFLVKALAKKPEDRYQSMADLVKALEELPAGREKRDLLTPTPSTDGKAGIGKKRAIIRNVVLTRREGSRRTWAVGIAGLILFALVAFGFLNNPGAIFRRTPTDTFSPTITLTPTITSTPTLTLTPTAIFTSTLTLTPTQVPISVENAANVALLRQLDGLYGCMAISPDGEILAAGMGDASLGLWQVSDGTLFRKLEGHSQYINSVAFSPDGQMIVSGSYDSLRLWQAFDSTLLRTFEELYVYVDNVAFSPDSKIIASSAMYEEEVKLWRTENGNLLRRLGHSSPVSSIVFSPDGKYLAVGQNTGVVVLWQVSNATYIRTLYGHTSQVNTLAFSPDGQTLASGSGDGTVRIWHVPDGILLHELEVHEYGVGTVAFSPDGQILVSGSADYSVRLWQVEDWTLLSTLEGHSGGISHVAFSSDGRILASASFEGSVRLWGVKP
jgi:serine/threonine protein kinase